MDFLLSRYYILTAHVNLWWGDCLRWGAAQSRGFRTRPEAARRTHTWTVMYNEALESMSQELKSEPKDMSYPCSHTYPLIHDFIQDPASNGTASFP
ncbi:hypothetical protein CRG98_005434 [Punica granatum]|uniref:Uncharacterized protein n=1 Tax=Punica granatum TaxID=22663 RepID=A0A2I0L212_PUNGR|nr:hypothetical protein CRG98_005434 [Punica granatum]